MTGKYKEEIKKKEIFCGITVLFLSKTQRYKTLRVGNSSSGEKIIGGSGGGGGVIWGNEREETRGGRGNKLYTMSNV